MKKIKIDKHNNEVKLIVDTRFYGRAAVLEASKDFTQSCWVFVDGDIDDELFVSLKPKSGSINLDTLGQEFYNYMLGIMQNARS